MPRRPGILREFLGAFHRDVNVGSAHATSGDLDENLAMLRERCRDGFDPNRARFVQPGRLHLGGDTRHQEPRKFGDRFWRKALTPSLKSRLTKRSFCSSDSRLMASAKEKLPTASRMACFVRATASGAL